MYGAIDDLYQKIKRFFSKSKLFFLRTISMVYMIQNENHDFYMYVYFTYQGCTQMLSGCGYT